MGCVGAGYLLARSGASAAQRKGSVRTDVECSSKPFWAEGSCNNQARCWCSCNSIPPHHPAQNSLRFCFQDLSFLISGKGMLGKKEKRKKKQGGVDCNENIWPDLWTGLIVWKERRVKGRCPQVSYFQHCTTYANGESKAHQKWREQLSSFMSPNH